MTDKEKIRAEIEKVKVIIQSYRVQGAFSEGYLIGQESLLGHFEKFVDSMQEEPTIQQMMKNAKDGVITFDYYGDNDKIYGCIAHDSFSLEELGLKDGDKVKLIIIKEDEQ